MLTQMSLSDVLVDLSTDEQQLLTGGNCSGSEDEGDSKSKLSPGGQEEEDGVRRYLVRSVGIISVKKL